MKHAKQMSESIELGVILAMSGGFMDAYSYLCRDHVFSNAQTGNIILLGISISKADWKLTARYFFPVLAFVFGIAMAEVLRLKLKGEESKLHWRQISVLCEAVILVGVSLLPQAQNLAANSLASLACGIQVESFRKIHGNGAATTMCIGNLRSATQHICEYWHTKDQVRLWKGILYYGIIFFFVIGAVIGYVAVEYVREKAILVSSGLLLLTFVLMFVDREKREKEG